MIVPILRAIFFDQNVLMAASTKDAIKDVKADSNVDAKEARNSEPPQAQTQTRSDKELAWLNHCITELRDLRIYTGGGLHREVVRPSKHTAKRVSNIMGYLAANHEKLSKLSCDQSIHQIFLKNWASAMLDESVVYSQYSSWGVWAVAVGVPVDIAFCHDDSISLCYRDVDSVIREDVEIFLKTFIHS